MQIDFKLRKDDLKQAPLVYFFSMTTLIRKTHMRTRVFPFSILCSHNSPKDKTKKTLYHFNKAFVCSFWRVMFLTVVCRSKLLTINWILLEWKKKRSEIEINMWENHNNQINLPYCYNQISYSILLQDTTPKRSPCKARSFVISRSPSNVHAV